MATPAIFFLDIDGTLLDEDYQCNDDSLPSTIKKMSQAGSIFCLNSNRSLEDLLPIAEQFSIEGLLIGENGVFMYDVRSKQTTLLVEDGLENTLVLRKQAFEIACKQILIDFYPDQDVTWLEADTVQVLKDANPYSDIPDGTIMALNNSFRKYTSSVHILRKEDGKLVHVPAKDLSALTAQLRDESHLSGTSNITHSVNFSNILLTPKEVSKKSATETVLQKFSNIKHVYSIGDEADDYLAIHGLGSFYTLANATDETKDASKGFSQAPYAEGVHELLITISEQLAGEPEPSRV